MAGGMIGGGRGPRRRYRPLAEINVTPLVDVMLVLLIIFMVTAPLITSSVNIDLPKVSATPLNQDSEPLKVQVDAQGQVFLQEAPVQLPDLVGKLQAIAQDHKDRRIFLRADKANSYERVLSVMATIIQGGFTKVALLTDPSGAPASPGAPTTPAGGGPVAPLAPATAIPTAPAASPRPPGRG